MLWKNFVMQSSPTHMDGAEKRSNGITSIFDNSNSIFKTRLFLVLVASNIGLSCQTENPNLVDEICKQLNNMDRWGFFFIKMPEFINFINMNLKKIVFIHVHVP